VLSLAFSLFNVALLILWTVFLSPMETLFIDIFVSFPPNHLGELAMIALHLPIVGGLATSIAGLRTAEPKAAHITAIVISLLTLLLVIVQIRNTGLFIPAEYFGQ
jgi:hypothetical protein